MKHWLIKSEPFKYSFQQLQKDGVTGWEGVRNYGARNNLRDMKQGDLALFYHSNEGLEIVGIARVAREAYPDPTTEEPAWLSVDFVAERPLDRPVTLKEIKANDRLADFCLVRLSRLSVGSVKPEEFDEILRMSQS